jgi:diaminohydroxyphosphoribosylaminopyrimidine deaminase/5-amino-6-(5-phosphoribosylamino)uracil reductase
MASPLSMGAKRAVRSSDAGFMRAALGLARRGFGRTSPNPMVGAVLVGGGRIVGRGWHHRAGEPHAEIEALRNAQARGCNPKGATLYVTLEPCCTHGRTPPCTESIIAAGIRRVVAGATDPNPRHSGKGFSVLRRAGIPVITGVMSQECEELNEAFNHWIVQRTPFVTVKAAMTLDGKIATAGGDSKWITGAPARAYGMKLRQAVDAILVGINTILADNPRLTIRTADRPLKRLRRIVLDTRARAPLSAHVVSDRNAELTTIVVGEQAPQSRVRELRRRVKVVVAPSRNGQLDLGWLLKRLGSENVTHLLVEGGGEVNSSFILGRLAQRVAFFYAPKILGGRDSRKAVAGGGVAGLGDAIRLDGVRWRRLGEDWLLTADCI